MGPLFIDQLEKSYLSELNTIANQALQICIGAFRTSPISSLQAISSEPPLHLRREELAMKYIIKLQANPSNPTYDTIFRHQPSPLFNTKWKAIPPLIIRMTSSLFYLNPNNSPFVTTQFSSVPLWTLKSLTILFDLTTNIKANNTPEIYKALYNELKQMYQNYQEIYHRWLVVKAQTKFRQQLFSSTQNSHSLLTYQLCLVSVQQNLQPSK